MAMRWVSALLIFFTTCEVCARVDDTATDGVPFFARYDESVLMTADEFGITGKPNAHYSKWRLNSLGFRGPELRPNTQRILCIGASETFGLYEPQGLEYPRQLERELQGRYQVVNAGLPGQSLSSFARRAVAVTREITPDIAVLYPSLAIYIDPPPERFAPGDWPGPSRFQIRFAGKLLPLLAAHVPQTLETGITRLVIRAQAPPGLAIARIPESNVTRFRRDLSRVLDLLEGERVRPILVTHATRFGSQTGPDDGAMLTAWRAQHPRLEEGGFLDMENRLNQALRDEAAQRNLSLVDAASWLHGPQNFVEFVHFTPKGAASLARAVADEILRTEER